MATKPLIEFVTDVIEHDDATPVNGRVSLLLDRSEIAYIVRVYVWTLLDSLLPDDLAADDRVTIDYALSRDPRFNDDISAIANKENRNIFAQGSFGFDSETDGTPLNHQFAMVDNFRHVWDFSDYPIEVAGDFGWLVDGDAGIAGDTFCLVHYYRAKARKGQRARVIEARG